MIHVGDRAPDFSAVSQHGATIRLADFLGRQNLVLFFYPKDGSLICTREACSFRDAYDEFVAAGAEVVGVSGDSPDNHRDFAAQHKLPFHLITDEEGQIREAFGVPKSLGVLPGRVTFVIDRKGIVRLVFSAQFATQEHVRRALKALG